MQINRSWLLQDLILRTTDSLTVLGSLKGRNASSQYIVSASYLALFKSRLASHTGP